MTRDTEPLENHVRFVGGGTPSRKRSDFYGGSIPWVTVKDLGDGLILHDTQERITPEAIKNSATNLIESNHILVCTRMAVGKAVLISRPMAINQDLKAIYHSEHLDTKFLLFFLKAKRKKLEAVATGATVKGITLDELRSLQLPVLEINEQRLIAQRLERADRLRRLRRHALTIGDEYLQNVFLEMFGDPETNPRGWEISTLEDMGADFRYGTSKKSDYDPVGVPVLRIPNVLNRRLDLTDLKFSRLESAEERRLILERGDIIFVRTNGNPDYVGRCTVFNSRDKYVYASYLIRARIDPSIVDPWFLESYLQHREGRKKMLPFIRTTAGQSNISIEGLGQIPVPLPPLTLQRAYAALVHKHERLRQMQIEALRQADQLYEALLEEAFGS